MPLSKYDRYYGGKPGSATEAHSAMVKRYGTEQGNAYFYGHVNKRKKVRKRRRKVRRRG